MAGKSWSASNTDSVIIPGNKKRDSLLIQAHSNSANAVFLQKGQTAEAGKGIELGPGVSAVKLRGNMARYAIHGITSSGSASGGYEEGF